MANYYTRTTLDKVVGLTSDLHDVFEKRGGTLYEEGEQETVLDGIVAERMPMSSYSVVFEEGLNGIMDDTVEGCLAEMEIEPDNVSDEFKRLVMLDEAELLLEILKLNPDIEELDLQSAHTCSKMRLGAFGGSGLIVNRTGYLYVSTATYEIDEDGIIQSTAAFRFWDDHLTIAERDAAAVKA
jgi:hypothetical protein